MISKKIIILFALISLIIFSGCPNIDPPPGDEQTRLYYMPIQCGGNPWEMWYSEGGIQYFDEPTESQLVMDYYTTVHGVELLQVKITPAPPGTTVCKACSCARGDTIEVRIYSRDEEKMLGLGWVTGFI